MLNTAGKTIGLYQKIEIFWQHFYFYKEERLFMSYVYLIRHCEAKAAHEDPESPLTDKGRKEAKASGVILAKRKVHPSKIYHSPKDRSKETAQIIAKALSLEDVLEEVEGLLPGDTPTVWNEKLQTTEETSVVVVGHLPFLARLAALLLKKKETSAPIFLPGSCLALEKEKKAFVQQWMLHAREAVEEA